MERIICGDNLAVLKTIQSESVDLCYIDPPFFTNKNYEVIWNDGAEIRQFGDRFGDEKDGKMHKDINKYLEWMEPRLREIYRVLKPTGSFYLHCDYHADAYLRVICDEIFGYNNLVNRITWKRHNGNYSSNFRYGIIADCIFWYSKTENYSFNPQYSEEKGIFPFIEEETGRKFRSHGMTKSGKSPNSLIFPRGEVKLGENIRFVWSQSTLDEKLKLNPYCIYYSTKSNIPQYKMYEDEYKGTILSDIWEDLPVKTSEQLGYPTQKPEALLERIIQASSNEGDIVLDAFCGCGTTLAVAKRLNRQFIGIDVSPTACRLVAWRLFGNGVPVEGFNASTFIEGLPITKEEISALSGIEFQNWISRELGIAEGKRGADGGIDGMVQGIPIQVKKYQAGRNDLDTFLGMLARNGKNEGIFIAIDFATTFLKEVRALKSKDIIIHTFSVQDIIEKKQTELMKELEWR